ncbi:glycerate kinase [Glaciihabitans sp. INWT7]|uniref:glycerate kinase n=1 Tax=Glaciihabitans sp. INWT7 TaxID=2596912 RepID=UPI001625F282|nr:glycerate kinase [Glaciihabitans sp. INWT7]QNE46378.1 glycerate kinase [Glaciihabitans sp. INWT7]
MRIVIAPDSFKGSLSALDVAQAIAAGWAAVRPGDSLTLIPLADGGEGTLDAVESSVPGARRHDAGPVTGPDGRQTPGAWLSLPDGTAVVELAQMSGIPLMRSLDPLGASTEGLGQVIRRALDSGASRLIIGLGGSASTDGAAGALSALGLRSDGTLTAGGAALASLGSLDRSQLSSPPPGGVTLLTDVSAPLLGPAGAAAVFGPQKGASTSEVVQLDAALAHFAELLGADPRSGHVTGGTVTTADPARPGTGAAGGAAYGFVAAWGARIEPGAEYLCALTGVPAAIAAADLLITGEGRFDATSSTGKLVGTLIGLAGERGVPVAVIAGQLAMAPVGYDGSPLWAAGLADVAGSAAAAMADPTRWLREAGAAAARAADHSPE